ncbi:MAG: AAA family ATPase [Eubacteriales bacterium]|nr:AAA family ATPase [Eubacteriales bacterium]
MPEFINDEFQYDKDFSSFKEYISYLLISHKICNNNIELVNKSNNGLVFFLVKYGAFTTLIILIVFNCIATRNFFDINIWNLITQSTTTMLLSLGMTVVIATGGIDLSVGSVMAFSAMVAAKFSIFPYSEKIIERLLSDKTKIESINNLIKQYRSSEVCYVFDADSHGIDSISSERCFWIKGQRCNYDMLIKALSDFSISLQLEKPNKPDKYIKGISIKPFKEGFLSGKEEHKYFSLMFSEDLNCIIGGRGTGKSTLIEMLIFVLSQNCTHRNLLQFICLHEYIMILYHYLNEDYIVFFTAPPFEYNIYDDITERFKDQEPYQKKSFYDPKQIEEYVLKHSIDIFKVKNEKLYLLSLKEKRKYLKEFFNIGYSINRFVSISNNGQISNFINSIILKNDEMYIKTNYGHVSTINGLKNKLNEITKNLETRKIEIDKVLNYFNKANAGKFIIKHRIDFYGFLSAKSLFNYAEGYFKNYNIRNQTLIDYFELIESEIGLPLLLLKICNNDISFFVDKYPIGKYTEELTQPLIEKGINLISESNIKTFYNLLFKHLISKENIRTFNFHIKEFLSNCEKFDLEFNINNKEYIGYQEPNYKSICKLSLGQKVVALLSFILSYGE